jgi:hypothetical protein
VFNDFLKFQKDLIKIIMTNCEFCEKTIQGTKWNKEYFHINIAQDEQKRFFCSRQCKLNWIFKKREI